jgi:preprotein translocase subunit SecD
MRIDGETMMAPVIREPIMGGSFQISGADLTADKLRALAERLCQDERCVRVQVEIVPD